MDGLACDTKGDVEKHQIGDVLQAEPASKLKLETIELHGEEFWPLSGKPFFNITISKSHVKPGYQMVTNISSFLLKTFLLVDKKWRYLLFVSYHNQENICTIEVVIARQARYVTSPLSWNTLYQHFLCRDDNDFFYYNPFTSFLGNEVMPS